MMYLMLLKSVCCGFRMLHHHPNRRRHQEHLRDAARFDQLERRARIELGHDDVHRAGSQSPHAVADAADVETRHRNEADVAIGPVVPFHVVVRRQPLQVEEAAVLQLHAFRMARRAARVHLDRDVVGRNDDARIGGALLVAPLRKVGPLAMPRRIEMMRFTCFSSPLICSTRPKKSGPTHNTSARLSLRMYATSGGASRQLMPTDTAPAFAAPNTS